MKGKEVFMRVFGFVTPVRPDNIMLQKRIVDNQQAKSTMLIPLFISFGALLLYKELIWGLIAILCLQLISSLHTTQRLDMIAVEMRENK